MDEAKNMALLFFVDHLIQKGGQRTIHDLSCQFGARGFTEQMRQAVGTTQEGLCEFLAQYPSLFTIQGEQIQLKGFGEAEEGRTHLSHIPPSGRQRDYVAEAVQFFVAKLEKFGPELQVKSLLGHRSQAAPEIRLVSGRHLKEFADFLASQTDYFIVDGDRVRLKHMPEPNGVEKNAFLDEEGRPLAGHRAKLAAIDFMKGVLEQNEDVPIPLDAFYRRFCDHFPHYIRQEVATNPKELLLFLKLNRHVFFIRSNKVQLVRNKQPTAADGSELGSDESSGRSTTDGDYACSERSATSPAESGGERMNGGALPKSATPVDAGLNTLFPLNRDNLHRVQLVQSLKQAQEAVRSLVADLGHSRSLNGVEQQAAPFLAVDFKLIQLGSAQEQFVALVIVASAQQLVVFDLAHTERILVDSGLSELLEESDKVLKVVHDVRRVATVLAQRWGIRIGRVFDTQIAHSVIQHDKFGKPLGDLRAISFVNLQRVYLPQSLVMSDVPPRKLSQTPNWADRPLSTELLLAACEECHCLASGLYRLLNAQLPSAHRQLFNELCADATAAETSSPLAAIGGAGWRNGHAAHQRHQRHSPQLVEVQQLQKQSSLERKVPPLMDLPLNGNYRPLHSLRRASGQNGHPSPFINGGYVPPPLRKASAASPPLSVPPPHRSITWPMPPPRPETREACTQTLSTGEIAVLKVYYDEENNNNNSRMNKAQQQQ